MNFKDYLNKKRGGEIKGQIVKTDTVDDMERPAFARNRGVEASPKVISKNDNFDTDDVEVATFKRIAADKGKSIEDEAQKGRLEFKKPLAPGEKSKWEMERQRRHDRAVERKKLRLDYDEGDIISDTTGERTQSELIKDLTNISKRIQNR